MVELEYRENVAILTLWDGKANAVGPQLLDAIEPALEEVQGNADALILTGMKGIFSAGFDLKAFAVAQEREKVLLAARGARLLLRLVTLPIPTVIAASGHSIALGALLLLTCDYRLGIAGAYKYGLNETGIGLDLPEFGCVLAESRLAPHRLREAVLGSRMYSAEEAVEAGFLDLVVDESSLMKEALSHAQRLAKLPGEAYTRNKARLTSDLAHRIELAIADLAG